MPPKAQFVRKLLRSLDRVDRTTLENYLLNLAGENQCGEEILHNINEGILLLDGKGNVHFANRTAQLRLGLPSLREDRPFLSVSEIVQDSVLRRFLLDNLDLLEGKRVTDIELLSPRELSLRVSLIPLRWDGSLKKLLVLLEDRKAPASSPARDENLSRIDALVRLAAGVAHEIGNPLNSISIHLALLRKHIKDLPEGKRKTVVKTLDVLSAETGRLDKIVRNFLKATRKPPLRFQTSDLNSILDEAIHFLNPELEQHKITVHYRPDRSLPLFLMDRERLHQAFINLIKNAMESMPSGGRIRLSVSHSGKVVMVQFVDDGKGIPDTDLPYIFEPYFTTKKSGSGLGLATVFDTVNEHGGRIEVASQVGRGTTFSLLLPIHQPKLQLPQYKAK